MSPMDDSVPSQAPTNMDGQSETAASHDIIDGDMMSEVAEEEVSSVLEVIAATGKYWLDWDLLKRMLSFRLKQVLSEYPESQPTPDIGPQPSSLSGETYSELIKRLDEALLSFDEGPPFTLQRICEILLAAKSIYPVLSKLALALEKNLLMTSMLAICTEPYPTTKEKSVEADKGMEGDFQPTQNGQSNGESDEEMTDVVEEESNKSTDTAIIDANEDIMSATNEAVIIDAKEDIMSATNEAVIIDAKEDIMSATNEAVIIDAKEDIMSATNEAVIIDAKENTMWETTEAVSMPATTEDAAGDFPSPGEQHNGQST